MKESIGPNGEYQVDGTQKPWLSLGSKELIEAKQEILCQRLMRNRTPKMLIIEEIEDLEKTQQEYREKAQGFFEWSDGDTAHLYVVMADICWRRAQRLREEINI